MSHITHQGLDEERFASKEMVQSGLAHHPLDKLRTYRSHLLYLSSLLHTAPGVRAILKRNRGIAGDFIDDRAKTLGFSPQNYAAYLRATL